MMEEFFKGSQKTCSKLLKTELNLMILQELLYLLMQVEHGNKMEEILVYTRDNSRFGHNIGTTAGVGIRLNTPIGPLRFDFGWPVGNKMDDDGMKFYFNMGQSF